MFKRKIYSIVAAAALVVMSSCKGYLDINTNPNAATSSSPDLVLPNALAASGGLLSHNELGHFWVGHWSPSGSVSGFTGEKTYDIASNFRNTIWTSSYDNLADYDYIEKQATAQKLQAYIGIAKVMKAYVFQRLVDTYGNVPYTEALQGPAGLRPKYDDAQAIYNDLVKQLDAASTALKNPISAENPSPGAADIVFAGDIAKWRRFANSLKLRIMLRQSNVAAKQAEIKSVITAAAGDGGFLAAGENAHVNPGYLKTAGKQNPFYENYGFTAADKLSGNHDFYTNANFFVTFLEGTNDPRLTRFAVKANDGKWRGVPFGDGNDAYLYAKTSGFGPAILKAFNQPQVLMQASESLFLQAEAVQRGYLTTGDARALYEAGIKESFTYLGVPDVATATTTYLTNSNPLISWTASSNKIETIITQKWIALGAFGGFEAWTEFRRTGFPAVPLSTRAIGTKQPQRLLYPTSELGTNAANVQAQGTISQFDSKLFWAK